MEQTIYSFADIKELKKDILKLKGVSQLRKTYSELKQEQIQEKLMDTVIESLDSVEIQYEIVDLLNHFIKYGYSEEVKIDGLSLLAIIRDAKAMVNELELQKKIFTILWHLAMPKDFELSDFNKKVNLEIIPFLKSSQEDIRKLTTIYYIDTKTNKYFNILNLPENLGDRQGFLLSLLDNLTGMVLEGPKKYYALNPENGFITSDDIIVKLFNQYINGKLVHDLEDIKESGYSAAVINALSKLSTHTIKDMNPVKIQYLDRLHKMSAKSLMKYAEQVYKNVQKEASEKDYWQSQAKIILNILNGLKIEKIQKDIEKSKKLLTMFDN